jgi:hypothetical protein
MVLRQKYVVTSDNVMIVFCELLSHDVFKRFDPISAGFIVIGATARHEPTCTCYGESISLGIKSREEDTDLADKQILGNLPSYK